MTSAMK